MSNYRAMNIIGIDPGIGRTGWGVVSKEGQKITPVNYGCIETPPSQLMPDRLFALHKSLAEIINKESPVCLAIEDLFFNTNAKTALVVGQARGVVLLTAAEFNIPVAIYTPLQVKIAMTGYGRAEKAQIGQMVKIILKLQSVPKPDDTADALAIALTHAFTAKIK